MTTNRNDINDITTSNDDAFATMESDQLAGVLGGGLHGQWGYKEDKKGNVDTVTGTYKVGSGDNLWTLANATGQSLDQLLKQNPQFGNGKRDPNLIYPGETIVLGHEKVPTQ